MFADALTWGRHRMAEIRDTVQHSRIDARNLWLPVGLWAVGAVLLVTAGMWIQRTNDRAGATDDLAIQLQTLNTQIATMQGSINALMGMQTELAKTSANVGALDSRLASFERNTNERLNMMDAWIQTTRGRLQESGFRDVPDYRPEGQQEN